MLQVGTRIVHIAVFTLAAALAWPSNAQPPKRADSAAGDAAVLAAREAFAAGDRSRLASAAAAIGEHPLKSYGEFWSLQLRLRGERSGAAAALDPAVADFVHRHPRSYVADRIRVDWLLNLGARREYATLLRERPAVVWGDDAQLRCYELLARYVTQERPRALAAEGRGLLAATRESASEGCTALAEQLLADGQLSAWSRVRALVEHNQLASARRAAGALPPADAAQAAQIIEQPGRWLATHERRISRQQVEPALLALARLSRDDPEKAAQFAASLNLHLTAEQRGLVWGRIGHMAALKLMAEAPGWYRHGGEQVGVAPDAARADEVLEWQVRAALRAGDWPTVRSTIERMPRPLADDPAWVYWHGRALAAAGQREAAELQYARIADRFEFYGKLAAEELGRPIVLPLPAAQVGADELAPMRANAGFQRALAFYRLGLRLEGHREWNWQLGVANDGGRMTDRQMLAAAEYARASGVIDRMISTSERTREEFDFTQRFPSPYRGALETHARSAGLEPTWVYGLIRQESRFIEDIRSSAGASGLMQLMPATASWVARKVGMSDYTAARVNEVDVNLRLGTTYLRMVLDDLDGHPALATAAYNAGPGRPRAWRAALPRAVEGAVFAETIPFNETRDYVKKVMSNAVYYAALFDSRAQSLKQRLGTVAPKAAGSTALP
ncbi:MAG: lytic transglycosylase domain-containing protein [Burkholderiaceae bacterium]|jgi:soluble lytic murein transglycosylase|nr:lytic transglycosylase domain-containing protein [Burkholderiaceae bacterium]